MATVDRRYGGFAATSLPPEGGLMSFDHPVLGRIEGYDSIEEFDAAIAAWNLSQGLDENGYPITDKEEP
jgi:hypothetical protein